MQNSEQQDWGEMDSRTHLPRRESFYREVRPLIAEADSSKKTLVLLVIDLDGIDFILRTFGPHERDSVIREIGHRIRQAAQSNNSHLYYITQGRFAVILPEPDYGHATRQAEAIVTTLKKPFDVSGVSYHLQAHIGISQYPNHANSLGELVRTSVFACHQARELKVAYATFDSELDERERHRFRLMVDLEQALKKGDELTLAYQPIINCKTGQCVGVEGLCRWHHPTHGLVPPGDFLPFVEQTSLMMSLTEATLSQGLADTAAWRSRGFNGHIAVNLSPSLFRQGDLFERLLEHCRFSNLEMSTLHLEVTETGIIDQPNRAIHALSEIRDHGSLISVDDFGTGHSSLAYLADLPIDTIKIDKHFVQNLSKSWGEAIVSATVTLAQKLGLTTIAEGIESESDFEKCRQIGTDLAQGFHIARPMYKEAFEKWLGI